MCVEIMVDIKNKFLQMTLKRAYFRVKIFSYKVNIIVQSVGAI